MLITRKIIQTFIYSQLCYYNPNKTSYRIYKQFYSTVCFRYSARYCLAKQVLVFLGIKVANIIARRFLIHRFLLTGVYCNCPYIVKPVLANVHKRSPKSWK